MPLYVTNGKLQLGEPGKLAAQRACCCDEEGDNPEDCVCPDFCLYQIQVISPVTTQKIPQTACGVGDNSEYFQSFDSGGQFPPCEDSSLCCAHSSEVYSLSSRYFFSGTPPGVSNIYASFVYAVYADLVPGTLADIKMSASVDLVFRCTGGNKPGLITGTNPKLFVDIGFGIMSHSPGLSFLSPRRRVSKFGTFEVPGACLKKANSSCDGDSAVISGYYLGGPVEFTVSLADAGLGSWDESRTVSGQEGDQSRITPCFEELAENFLATFRITQRQSCRIVNCDCSTDVCGLVADVRAYPGGPLVEWILCKPEEEQSRDREFSCTIEGVSYTCLYKYREVTETRNGFAVDIHRFIYERFANPPDVSGFPRERKVADLWCDGDGWMMDFQTVCYRVDLDTGFGGGYEEDRVVGEILCGPACGNDGSSRAPGDPIPLGSAVEVIGVPGFPYSEGDFSCDIGLGERMSVEIRQTLTC